MKLIKKEKPLPYALMWKCQSPDCRKWNPADVDSCLKCSRRQPIAVDEVRPLRQFIRMLDTLIEFAQDHGMGSSAPTILRAIIIAYETRTEGHLESLCRVFGLLHSMYRIDGDKVLNWKGVWKDTKQKS